MRDEILKMYQDKVLWKRSQQNGIEIIHKLYSASEGRQKLLESIETLIQDLGNDRSKNFIGQMLQHHTLKSYKYLGKWIEEKNKS